MAVQTSPVSALPGPAVNPPSTALVPFRRATVERVETLISDTIQQGTGSIRVERSIDGSGYLYGVVLDVSLATTGNAAVVAFYEDAPWSLLDTVVLRDNNGELVNLTGYGLFVANLANRQYALRGPDQAGIANLGTAGAVGTGGSARFLIRVPVALNRRSLDGLQGNQDRSQKFFLRTDIASGAAGAGGPVYTTAPTALGTITINRFYENYSIPQPVTPDGTPQQSFPDSFGLIPFLTETLSEALPVGGSTVSHFLRRIGNTTRFLALVFRSNGTRANADAAFAGTTPPYGAGIRFKAGDDTLFYESYAYRRWLMFERYGFEFPPGVLVYDCIHDFTGVAGAEIGDDWYATQQLVNMQVQISYPSGFGSTNNSLRIVTSDLIYQPPVIGQAR